MANRDEAVKVAERTDATEDEVYARKIRNRTKNLANKAQIDSYNNQLDANSGNQSKYWQHIFTILNKNKNDTKFNWEDDNFVVLDQSEVPNYINAFFFTSIGTKLVDENPKMQVFFKLPEIDNTIELFELQEIQMDQLMSLLKQIKVFKSSGIDNISSQVLKDALFILNNQMLYLINLSIRSGVFPNKWKRSTAIPLPKVNNPIKVGDLHSITLLPIPSKITEKITYGQLMDFLENNTYLNDNQFGFCKNKPTIGAAFKFVNDISSNNNEKL